MEEGYSNKKNYLQKYKYLVHNFSMSPQEKKWNTSRLCIMHMCKWLWDIYSKKKYYMLMKTLLIKFANKYHIGQILLKIFAE